MTLRVIFWGSRIFTAIYMAVHQKALYTDGHVRNDLDLGDSLESIAGNQGLI
jgi:hypothetical protein